MEQGPGPVRHAPGPFRCGAGLRPSSVQAAVHPGAVRVAIQGKHFVNQKAARFPARPRAIRPRKAIRVQGTILILDGVPTTRIMLKVQLSAAWYHVVQADRLAGVDQMVRRVRPDLIITAQHLPDGSALDLPALLRADPALGDVPIIALVGQNDRAAQLRALAAGMDDALCQPVDDRLLQARIRSLIRAGFAAEDLALGSPAPGLDDLPPPGLAETAARYAVPSAGPAAGRPALPSLAAASPLAQVVLLTAARATGTAWAAALAAEPAQDGNRYSCRRADDIHGLMRDNGPDAVVIDLASAPEDAALRLLSDLRARGTTRDTVVIAVLAPGSPRIAAEALDRGAHDVLTNGFDAPELALRLAAQLRRKARSDRLRANLRDGLRAALFDPMTGLHNRRYAMPRLARIAAEAARHGEGFAVMLADLDHFKGVNDRFGHPAGDAVLAEAARRLRDALPPASHADVAGDLAGDLWGDLIARIGGEEFLIALPGRDRAAAERIARRLCHCVKSRPFSAPGVAQPIHVTVSIGVALWPEMAPQAAPSPLESRPLSDTDGTQALAQLIRRADRALYAAKRGGRNQVTVSPRPAAA